LCRLLQYRRSKAEMPAHAWEIEGAEKEGVEFQFLSAPKRFTGADGRLTGIESLQMELGRPDVAGRRKPEPVPGSEYHIAADLVITAVGLLPDTGSLGSELELNADGTIVVNPVTLQTSLPYVFAGGDVVTGPSMIVNAVGQGRKAAFFIDRFLGGVEPLKSGYD